MSLGADDRPDQCREYLVRLKSVEAEWLSVEAHSKSAVTRYTVSSSPSASHS